MAGRALAAFLVLLCADTAELIVQCNRCPHDCDYAVDEVLLELRGGPGK